MNKYPIYSKDNNNVKVIKKISKNIVLGTNQIFSNIIKKIEKLLNLDDYSCILIKNFLKVDQSLYKGQQKIKFEKDCNDYF